jgi:hypothetical protein
MTRFSTANQLSAASGNLQIVASAKNRAGFSQTNPQLAVRAPLPALPERWLQVRGHNVRTFLDDVLLAPSHRSAFIRAVWMVGA